MRRLATALLHAGVVGIVFGLSLIHGEYVGDYDFVQTSRFGWAIAYCLVLGIALYGLGLPDSYRDLRSVIGPAIGAAVVGALGVSLMQLVLFIDQELEIPMDLSELSLEMFATVDALIEELQQLQPEG